MACYHPLYGYRDPNGGFSYKAVKNGDAVMSIPCNNCIGCRIDRSRSWALRICHESMLHDVNWFVTLTYADNPVSLCYEDVQKFHRRMRKAFGSFRFFLCGEYGEQFRRPHYHGCYFGLRIPDLVRRTSVEGQLSWESRELGLLWGKGFVHIGELNYQTAHYAARYIFKKIGGDLAEEHYKFVDQDGVVHSLEPEFCRMSNRPGIGKGWFERFGESDCVRHDFLVHDGKRFSVPKYYDKLLKRQDELRLLEAKAGREFKSLKFSGERTESRLAVREAVSKARIDSFDRSFENG